MSHLDEGTLHALLDGELELAEVREIQTHLGICAACDSRLQDVKQFLAEADRLVGALETPAGPTRARREPAPPPAGPVRPSRDPQPWEPAPELLLPDSGEIADPRWGRTFRWAAVILVVFGVGRMINGALRPDDAMLELSTREAAPPATPPAVVSPEETVRPESVVPRESRPAAANRAPVAKTAPPPKARADRPAVAGVDDDDELDTVAAATEDSGTTPQDTQTLVVRGNDAAAEQGSEDQDLATRQAAAAALEELDRERLRTRANAATASLSRVEPQPPPAAEPPPAPAPRTLEQRAQVYLRIGLDEAVTQLGRPVHVIEAMSAELIGLAPGRLVPGADPNRPVVRVVYMDRGRMVLLDQQRLRTGQAPGAAAGNLRWIQGDVMLYLHGEPTAEVLRNLQRRVR